VDAIGIWKFLGESNMGLSKEYPCKEEGDGSYASNISSERGTMKGKNAKDLIWKSKDTQKLILLKRQDPIAAGKAKETKLVDSA